MVVLSDLSETVCKHKVWSKKIYPEEPKKDKSHLTDFFYLASEAWIVCRLLSKVKNELKKYIIYVTLGLAFLSLMSAYWWKNYNLNFKKLDFKGHFKLDVKGHFGKNSKSYQ